MVSFICIPVLVEHVRFIAKLKAHKSAFFTRCGFISCSGIEGKCFCVSVVQRVKFFSLGNVLFLLILSTYMTMRLRGLSCWSQGDVWRSVCSA